MSLILGIIIKDSIHIQTYYLHQILIEIKHYLTLQNNIILNDNDYSLSISSPRKLLSNDNNTINIFHIPKNFNYLYTHYQKIYVENQEDLQFFDVCYQCLIIIKQYLPTKISISVEIIQDLISQRTLSTENKQLSLVDFVQNFQNQKNQEFSRRINSNFKSLISQSQNQITKFQVQNLLYLSEHFYFYKNKILALKFLAYNQNISKQTFALIDQKYQGFLKQLSIDTDFKPFCDQILQKIMVARQIMQNKNQEEVSQIQNDSKFQQKNSNNQFVSYLKNESFQKSPTKSQKQFRLSSKQKIDKKDNQKKLSPLKKSQKNNNKNIQNPIFAQKQNKQSNISVKSILFQLRQSHSLKRLAMLINTASQIKIEDQKYETKIEKQIENVCKRFLKQSYYERYSTNQGNLQQSYKTSNFDKNKNNNIKNQFSSGNQQDTNEAGIFYQSLICYFSKKDPSIKAKTVKHPKSLKSCKDDINRSYGIKQSKYKQLLQKICKKIQQQYYCQ